jgi:hypothetical protein
MKNKSHYSQVITVATTLLLIGAQAVSVYAQTLTDYYCSTFSNDAWGCPVTGLKSICEDSQCTYVIYYGFVTLCRPKRGYTCTYAPPRSISLLRGIRA